MTYWDVIGVPVIVVSVFNSGPLIYSYSGKRSWKK